MAASKRAKKIRQAGEFDLARLTAELKTPTFPSAVYSWKLPAIMAARNDQLAGQFEAPARMAKAMRTDPAIAVSYKNRLKPQQSLQVEIKPAKGSRAKAVAQEAEALFGQRGVGIRRGSLNKITGCLANHGIAIGCNVWTPRADGSRVDVEMRYWPIEFVRWDSTRDCLMTRISATQDIDGTVHDRGYAEIPIVHGDGRFVVFANHDVEPWTEEACLLSGALVWAGHAFAMRDWNKGSASHGNAKVVGTLPESIPIDSDEGAAFKELIKSIASDDSPAVLKPFGATLEYIMNGSRAYQVWSELSDTCKRTAARIYCGTDAFLGAQGGAPGVDVTALFGVAVTIVTGDLRDAIEPGILTGLIEPWCAVNFGDSSLAPSREYMIPDVDADAVRESFAKRQQAFFADIQAARGAGFNVDQEYVETVAAMYDVPVPQLLAAVPMPATEPAPLAVVPAA